MAGDPPPPVGPEILAEIAARLERIERDHEVRILLAVESGSRAWGFPSPDSDYDVRFLYAHSLEWYLSIEKRRDVIELPIEDDLDINGWDMTKALKLLVKPNPVLLEWMESPIVYRQTPWVLERLRGLADRSLHRHTSAYHYLHLAEGQYRRFIADKKTVGLKKYFYSLRPALALSWLRGNPQGRVPMSMAELLAGAEVPADVRAFIDELIERKRVTKELGRGPRIAALDCFIESKIAEARALTSPKAGKPVELIAGADALLRDILLAP